MATTLVLGSTGMVGAYILSTLRSASTAQVGSIATISRRDPPNATDSSKQAISPIVDKDTSKWSGALKSLQPYPTILFSSLATTRSAAGGFDKQYKIEHDLNIELAKTAKENGTKVYVLISAQGANSNAYFNYTKMKGEIEDHVKELDYDHTIIIRPGLIAGSREESRPAEAVIRIIASIMGKISSHYLKDFWAQDADVIARAAVNVALKASKGEITEKVKILSASDIIKYGRTEWNDLKSGTER